MVAAEAMEVSAFFAARSCVSNCLSWWVAGDAPRFQLLRLGWRYMTQIPPPIKASPIKSFSQRTVSLSNAERDRLIVEFLKHGPGLSSRDRLLSSVLSRLCFSIVCAYWLIYPLGSFGKAH
jgi:hypothetical protein